MKSYALILTGILVLFVFGVSVVFASIALPPSDPGNFPPGPSISAEQIRQIKACEETHRRSLEACRRDVTGREHGRYVSTHFTDPECVKRANRALNECIEFILNPPQLILPNGGK